MTGKISFEQARQDERLWAQRFADKYAQVGGATGILGRATDDAIAWDSAGGGDWVQHFEAGALCGGVENVVFEVHGLIHERWLALGQGNFGWPMIDESGTPDGKGKFNHFSNEGSVSSIYWTPETGAHEIHGAIRDRWSQLGWEGSFLGYPTSDETDNPDNESTGRGDRYSLFQGGFISWSEHGAHEHRTGTQHAFKVDRMFISVTRSGEVIGSPQDTDVISLQVKVGAQEVEPIFRTLGEFGDGGPYNIGISLPFTADDPAAPVVASFQLANSEKGDTEELKQTMKDAFKEVSSETASAGGAAIGGAIGGIGGPIGAGIGALVGAVAGKLVDAFYADCDGLVATDAVYVSGATLNDNVATGPHIETKEYPGTDSPVGCGDNSHYQVTWQVS